MPKVALVCRNLKGMSGGVERIIIWLANRLVEDNFEVSLISWDEEPGEPFYKVDQRVKIKNIGIGNPFLKATFNQKIRRIIKLRKIVADFDADVVIGFQIGTLVPLWLATRFRRAKLVCTERNSLQFLNLLNYRHSKISPYLYALADLTVVQFEEYKKYFPAITKLSVINNPVDKPVNATDTGREKLILTVGRLSFQKNFEILIEAFSLIHVKYPSWKLIILGKGEDKESLEKLIASKGLDQIIKIHPPVSDVMSYYKRARVFCLPSRWEGFPNALAEALATGLPAVGFRDCDGVNILIRDSQNGYLAEKRTPQDLADKIELLINEGEAGYKAKSQNASILVNQYHPDAIYQQWTKMIEGLLA